MLKYTPIYAALMKWLNYKAITEWKKAGCPVPPPHAIKQQLVKSFAKKYDIRILVETGTFYGDMIEAMKEMFDSIYSIELSKHYYEKAILRFKSDPNVTLLHGDSGKILGEVMAEIKQPMLFWLDGHYSSGLTAKGDQSTPIFAELDFILNHHNDRHVILIDDARLFGTDPDYPTIEELESFIYKQKNVVAISILHDCICLTPQRTAESYQTF